MIQPSGPTEPSLFYDRQVDRYDTAANRRFYQSIAAGLLDALGDDRVATILEIGAGTGFATTLLRQRHPEARIVALEPSPAMARRGRERVSDAVWRLEPVSQFDPSPVDLVFSSMSYHWLSEVERQKLARSSSQGQFAIAVSVTDRLDPAESHTDMPDGNARLKQLVYELRPQSRWSRHDRRTDLLVSALAQDFRRIACSHLNITETFSDRRDFADTMYSRGTLLALFADQADDAHTKLAQSDIKREPISFRWQIALITGAHE